MVDSRMEELSWKYLRGRITPKEKNELQALADASAENREFLDRITSNAFREKLKILRSIDFRELDHKMKHRLGLDSPAFDHASGTTVLQRIGHPLAVAAFIIAVAVMAWGLYYTLRSKKPQPYPASDATLTWHGTTVDLGHMMEGVAYKAGQIQIDRMGNEFFIHQRPELRTSAQDIVQYCLAVEGQQDIQVFFQDTLRTQIYPRSGITFTSYPTDTVVRKKELACYGRVLFDVNHNCRTPLVVKTPKQEISVLGTFFEVKDYNREDTAAVFCYSGKIRVEGPRKDTRVLTARQRITVGPKVAPRVYTGDFHEAQWSSAELVFDFTNMNLDSAMNEIAHWYDVLYVVFQPGINRKMPGTVYTGKISRYLSLQQLLAILERDDLHFSIQGQTILVKK